MSEEKEIKKSNSSVVILLVLLIMILSIGIGYLIGAKNIVKVDSKKEEESEVIEQIDKETETVVYNVNDEVVTSSMDKILNFGFQCNNLEKYVTDKKYKSSNIPSKTAYAMVEFKEFKNKNISTITLDEYTKAVQKYLGKDYIFNPDEIDISGYYCNQYNYDKETKTFTAQETACGRTCGPGTTYQVIKAIEKDGQLEISTSVVFSDGNKYYSDYQKTDVIAEHIYDTTLIPYDKGSKYLFKFKLEDGNYVFVSSEPVNKKIENIE